MSDLASGFAEIVASTPDSPYSTRQLAKAIAEQNKLHQQQLDTMQQQHLLEMQELQKQAAAFTERSEAIVAQGAALATQCELLQHLIEASNGQTAALERIAEAFTAFVCNFRECMHTTHFPDHPDSVRTGLRVHNRVS